MVVRFRFIGKDPPSKNGDSPSLWVDETDGSLVFQLYRVEDPGEVAALLDTSGRDHVPAHEVLGRLPATMIPILQEAIGEPTTQRPGQRRLAPGTGDGSDSG